MNKILCKSCQQKKKKKTANYFDLIIKCNKKTGFILYWVFDVSKFYLVLNDAVVFYIYFSIE